jgi:membrane protein YqaA with SNARE-associated domain
MLTILWPPSSPPQSELSSLPRGLELDSRVQLIVSTFAPSSAAVPRQRHSLVPHWLAKLGPLGLFLVAVVDSSVIPLPIPGSTDLLLLFLVSHNDGDPWLLALCAVAGSILGGYTTWHIGKKGGQAALRRYVNARLLGRIVSLVERHPILAVFLPAVLPPPIPLSPFILASGALGVARNRFLIVFGAARTLRYGLVAWLAVAYGRHMVRMWSKELEEWSTTLLAVFFGLLAAGICYGIWKLRAHRKSGAAEDSAIESAPAPVH